MTASNPNSSSNLTYEDAQNRSGYSDSPGSQRWYSEHLGHTQPFTPPDPESYEASMWCERSPWGSPRTNQNMEWNSECLEEQGVHASFPMLPPTRGVQSHFGS